MPTYLFGKTHDTGRRMWEIRDDGRVLAEFRHERFSHLFSGMQVYFIDRDQDGICENVQGVREVDALIKLATPEAKIQEDAQALLLDYLMYCLRGLLELHGVEALACRRLEERMTGIRNDAHRTSRPVTLALLAEHGIH